MDKQPVSHSSAHGLAAIAIRVTGIVIVLFAVRQGAAAVHVAINTPSDPLLWAVLTPFVLMICVGLVMIAVPSLVANGLLPPQYPGPAEASLTMSELELLACVLAGLFFLVHALMDATYLATMFLTTKQMRMEFTWSAHWIAIAVTSAFQFAVALGLIFGARGIARLIRWAREAVKGA